MPVAGATRLPLSFHQERLWMHQYLHPRSSAYNMTYALELQGDLAPPLLLAAYADVVRRHDILRTRYELAGSEPVQIVDAEAAAPCAVESVAGDALEGRVRELAGRPFDCAADHPIRAWLLSVATDRHVLLVVVHHIAADGASVAQIVEEIVAGYDGRRTQGAAFRPAPSGQQYASFCLWQRQQARDGAFEHELRYWQQTLAAAPVSLGLQPRGASSDSASAAVRVPIDARLWPWMRNWQRQERVTAFMILLALWQFVLAHCTGVRPITTGTDVDGRPHPRWDRVVGYFSNQVVLCSDVTSAGTFRGLLAQVRRTCLAAFAHQQVPFQTVVERLNPPRQGSLVPWMDAKIVEIPGASSTRRLGALVLRRLKVEPAMSRFPLTLFVAAPGGDRPELSLAFDPTLFSSADALGYAGDYARAAAALPQRCDDPLHRLLES